MDQYGKGVAVGIAFAAVIALLIYLNSRHIPQANAAPVQVWPGNEPPKEGPIYDVTPEKVSDGPVVAGSGPDGPGTTLEVLPKQGEISETFRHSENYRVVIFKGIRYYLTLYQSQAIEALHGAFMSGFDEVHQDVILGENDTCGRRLRDVFKSNMEAFRALVVRGVRKGTFRLASV